MKILNRIFNYRPHPAKGPRGSRIAGQIRNHEIRSKRAAGVTVDELATAYNLSPMTIYAITRGIPKETANEYATRDLDITKAYENGENSEALAQQYGLSRERVCQILRRSNAIELRASRRRTLRETFKEEGEALAAEAKAEFEQKLSAAIEAVRGGKSIAQAAREVGLFGHKLNVLQQACKRAGVETQYGRWRDHGPRIERVKELRAQNLPWAKISEICEAEGLGRVSPQWVDNHLPDLAHARLPNFNQRERVAKIKLPKQAVVPKPSPWNEANTQQLIDLWLTGSSAQQCVDIFGDGFTRNMIIGKINRLRNEGRLRPASVPTERATERT